MRFKRGLMLIIGITSIIFCSVGCGSAKEDTAKEDTAKDEYVLEVKNGERIFKSEEEPSNEYEKVILDSFKIEISDEYDNFKKVYFDNETYKEYPNIYKKNFNDGLYTEKLTVHSLEEVKDQEYLDKNDKERYYPYIDGLMKAKLSAVTVVEVKYTNELTEKYNEVAQWGSGTWTRYFVMAKEKEDSTWMIYDIYGQM